ncbi:MAG: TraB/GumN family protein [Sphingomonas sp.]|uniref:TraB/GumN family protein n=1 Tax=Sphingomonas sp. TaxID=28214 RepID=UPI001AD1157A|nr:TraB/GumN family protein [Sphingomonas sp.]MBN8808573.1 TraB/GumN family protein [Sphingomonas sp.]
MARLRRLIAMLAGVLALAACSVADDSARPPLWKATKDGTTVWLLGGMHLLPPGTDWRGGAVGAAIASADTLVLESDPGDTAGFDAIAKDPSLPPLAKRIEPTRADTLDQAIARTGQPAGAFDAYKDWAAAVMLGVGDAQDAGATAQDGVDAVLWQAFAGKKRVALEGPGAQVRVLDLLPPQLQHRMLDEALDGPRYEAVLGAWRDGDVAALDKAGPSKELRPFLVTAASHRWADRIARAVGGNETLLVAVGAGHVVGKDSLIDLLKAKGFTIERLQ